MSTPVVDSARCVGHQDSKRMEWKGLCISTHHLAAAQFQPFPFFFWIAVATQSVNDEETNLLSVEPVPSFLSSTDWLG